MPTGAAARVRPLTLPVLLVTSACATVSSDVYRSWTAGAIGCPREEITLSEEKNVVWTGQGMDWRAECKNGAAEFNGPFLANPLMDGATFLTPTIVRYLASDKIVVDFTYRRADGISETRAQLAAGFPTAAPATVGISWIRPETVAPAYAVQIFHAQGNDRTDLPFTVTSATVACTGNSLCALDGSGHYLVNSLNSPNVTMYQLSSRDRFGTIKYNQLLQ